MKHSSHFLYSPFSAMSRYHKFFSKCQYTDSGVWLQHKRRTRWVNNLRAWEEKVVGISKNRDSERAKTCKHSFLVKKSESVPLKPRGAQRIPGSLRFPDYVTMAQNGGKVVSLTNRPFLPPRDTPGTHFCYRLSRLQDHSAIGRVKSMKNSDDTSWNRTSDLPICSTAP